MFQIIAETAPGSGFTVEHLLAISNIGLILVSLVLTIATAMDARAFERISLALISAFGRKSKSASPADEIKIAEREAHRLHVLALEADKHVAKIRELKIAKLLPPDTGAGEL
jgi:hypothetical protein